MNKLRHLFSTVLAILLLVPAHAADKVRVQLKWLHQFQFAGYYAAIEKGYYRDAGLDVTLIEGAPGVDPAKVVLNGSAEFGVGTPELVLERAAGAPIVVLGVIFQHSPYVFLALEGTGITDVAALAGKRVMIEPQAAELYAYLLHEGVNRGAVQIVPHTFSVQDLADGKVAAMSGYSTDEPFTLQSQHRRYLAFTPRAGGVDFYGDCFFTTEAQIHDHPARVRAFREATLKGWDYALKHPEEIIDLLVAKYHSRKSREALQFEAAQMRELMHPEIIPVGYMYAGRWKHIADT
ncbi:MAG: ABC transporter substrate-binding protein, partial [Chthoniobacterales bacterium]